MNPPCTGAYAGVGVLLRPPPLIQRLAESLRNFWPDFKPPYPLEKILRTPLTLYIYNYLISLMKNYDINAYNRKTDI